MASVQALFPTLGRDEFGMLLPLFVGDGDFRADLQLPGNLAEVGCLFEPLMRQEVSEVLFYRWRHHNAVEIIVGRF